MTKGKKFGIWPAALGLLAVSAAAGSIAALHGGAPRAGEPRQAAPVNPAGGAAGAGVTSAETEAVSPQPQAGGAVLRPKADEPRDERLPDGQNGIQIDVSGVQESEAPPGEPLRHPLYRYESVEQMPLGQDSDEEQTES
ncbi:hypothetical protein QWJ34_01320 [Saccharibacillus sp. CPCC 101409]|uniref:hypothetical protein n=1 Tax=Saccharibacillus sp. CPCC 101409 TaxID=3058041 RepID=UPI0026726AEE|nr:hypothetical protein [Saccharibacillus sp. CPCC 101409]MDO3408400.1 hypothetical protein [Saccharibacillus sp. CPCC 101409]